MFKIYNKFPIGIVMLLLSLVGCKKMLEIAPPINSITTEAVFATSQQAEMALSAIYSKMIHGTNIDPVFMTEAGAGTECFSAGLSTLLGAFSSGELVPGYLSSGVFDKVGSSKILRNNSNELLPLWSSAYRTIFDCNNVLDGLNNSTDLTDSVKNQLTGEALFIRAFSYFYLVNFYGDVPLLLTTDHRITTVAARTSTNAVYQQILKDITTAIPMLSNTFEVGKNKRVRVNSWAAEALLARVSLYTGNHSQAIASATKLIEQEALFKLEAAPATVFDATSMETVLALVPSAAHPYFGSNTPEAAVLNLPPTASNNISYYQVNPHLFNNYAANDERRSAWFKVTPDNIQVAKYKYNEGMTNYTLIRLAEMYLIRAEAIMLFTPSEKSAAVKDLNALRERAKVVLLDANLLTDDQVLDAVAQERAFELFAEWGHRWFDLKRTGKAVNVLTSMTHKQPWAGDHQLLYPIPDAEILLNANLKQTTGYNY